MFRWIISTLLLGLLCLSPSAKGVEPFIVKDAAPGEYLLTVATDGTVTLVPTRVVRPVGSDPTQPLPPTVTPLSEFSKGISHLTKLTLTEGGTPTTAALVSLVYARTGEGVADGSIAPATASEAVRKTVSVLMEGQPGILTAQPDKDKWTAFNLKLQNTIDELRVAGAFSTKEQVANVLKEISLGMNDGSGFQPSYLEAAASGDPAALAIFDNFDITKILEIIEIIMKLLAIFKK